MLGKRKTFLLMYTSFVLIEVNRLLSALMRFSMKLKVTEAELAIIRPVERNCSKHISVVNDIYSYEKELLASQRGHQEGGVLCSSVPIMGAEADVGIDAAKRILYVMCREWEAVHLKLVAEIEGGKGKGSQPLSAYMKGLEYQMSGNELWSQTTKRYNQVTVV